MIAPSGFARLIVKAAERVRPGASAVLDDMPPAALARIASMAARGLVRAPLLGAAGTSLLVGRRVTIRDPSQVFLGRGVIIEDGVEIQGRSRRGITLGDGVTIRNGAMLRPSSYYGREQGEGCIVGPGSNVGALCYLGCAGFIEIGRDVLMGSMVQLIAEEHVVTGDETIKAAGTTRRGIRIGDGCWLGAGSIVLDGVELGAGCVVGAGAVVTRSWPAGSVLAGVPATLLRESAAGEEPAPGERLATGNAESATRDAESPTRDAEND
jgi:acetyltransferase-like isoleucine patch superfamily enzyme